MSSESLHSEAAARNAALTRSRDEHRALARVIEALETITAQIAETDIELRAEETTLLPLAEHYRTDDAWLAMADAFGANGDPLFGGSRRTEFDRLSQRIANLAPRKLKLWLLRPACSL